MLFKPLLWVTNDKKKLNEKKVLGNLNVGNNIPALAAGWIQ